MKNNSLFVTDWQPNASEFRRNFTGENPQELIVKQRTHWSKLHQYGGDSASAFFRDWQRQIPGCSACRKHWRQAVEQNPPPLGNSDAFWRWGIERHNDVNRRLGKPQLSLDEAHAVFRPIRHQPQSFDVPFVTALSRLPKHLERQATCLDSWVSFGAKIIATNTAEEIAELQPIYPQVNQWIQCNEVSTAYNYPTQLIRNMAGVAVLLDRPVLLINSDIEVRGAQHVLNEIMADECQVLGIRWNYAKPGEYWNATQFQWGIDAMGFTPKQAKLIPQNFPMAIGQAMWDYALPYFQLRDGGNLRLIHERFFFHQEHANHWNQGAWKFGAQWMEKNTEIKIVSDQSSATWRESWTSSVYQKEHGQYLEWDSKQQPERMNLVDWGFTQDRAALLRSYQ